MPGKDQGPCYPTVNWTRDVTGYRLGAGVRCVGVGRTQRPVEDCEVDGLSGEVEQMLPRVERRPEDRRVAVELQALGYAFNETHSATTTRLCDHCTLMKAAPAVVLPPAIIWTARRGVHCEEIVVHVEGVARHDEREDDDEQHDDEHEYEGKMSENAMNKVKHV